MVLQSIAEAKGFVDTHLVFSAMYSVLFCFVFLKFLSSHLTNREIEGK